jgi:ssDNA-specific exonuclease RecJ
MIDDNENHYAKELAQRTRSMLDQFGYVMPEYRQQFNAIQGEIIQKKQQDFYRINQNQRPSWLTGAGNPEQIQAIYNQLRNLGFNPAQIAEQLRQQGIQIE